MKKHIKAMEVITAESLARWCLSGDILSCLKEGFKHWEICRHLEDVLYVKLASAFEEVLGEGEVEYGSISSKDLIEPLHKAISDSFFWDREALLTDFEVALKEAVEGVAEFYSEVVKDGNVVYTGKVSPTFEEVNNEAMGYIDEVGINKNELYIIRFYKNGKWYREHDVFNVEDEEYLLSVGLVR